MVAVAGWLRLPGLRPRGVAVGGWAVHVFRVRRPNLRYGWDDFRWHPYAADRVVYRLLAFRHRKGRDLGAELETVAGSRLLPDGLGHASSVAVCSGASGPGPVNRDS